MTWKQRIITIAMVAPYMPANAAKLREAQVRLAQQRGGIVLYKRKFIRGKDGRFVSGIAIKVIQPPRSAARLGANGKETAADADAREARKARYLASRQARGEAVAHLTAEELASYRQNNPVPDEFWEHHGKKNVG